MGKQHDTFPNEQPEMPVPKETPEINQPSDPKQPETPQEDPQVVPDEFPPEENSPGPVILRGRSTSCCASPARILMNIT